MANLGFASGVEGEAESQNELFKEKVFQELKERFKPEFLNRIDEIIIFNSLKKSDIGNIVDKQLEELKARIEEKGMKLVIDPSIRAYLINNGYSAEYGARPLKRLIQKVITDKMADKMIKGQLKHGGKAKINLSKSIEEVPEPVVTIS